MVEVAHAAVRSRDSRFRALFLLVIAKKGKKTAYVAVARKMLTIIWHLLVKGERYVEKGFEKTKNWKGANLKNLISSTGLHDLLCLE
jgi:hypothetical protein